jgi:3-hydroxybutyryl-CoA dehydrogenase
MKNIAVIGAGVMGSDVALNLACYGYDVILKDIDTSILDKSKAKIVSDFRMLKMLKAEFKEITAEELLSRIRFTEDYTDFGSVDMVIENVPEEWDVKQTVYQKLRAVCNPDILFGVNTSCISITKVASLLQQPENVIGMHFMNPVPLKEMVELIRGYHTTEETIGKAKAFLKTIRKVSVVAYDMPGFIANRLSHLFMNEAAFLVQDKVGTPRDIDMLFRKGYGHAMGPLETADLIGLDTVVNSLDILYTAYQDSKFRCCPLLRKMLDAGLKGKKSGEGFYRY